MIFNITLRFLYTALMAAVLAMLVACTGTDRSSDPAGPQTGGPVAHQPAEPDDTTETPPQSSDEREQIVGTATQRSDAPAAVASGLATARPNKGEFPSRDRMISELFSQSRIAGRVSDMKAYSPYPLDALRAPSEPINRENYENFESNPVRLVSEHPVSTFSIDVDTGSYANVRRLLNAGQLPPQDAVRVEELINYFSYQYPVPDKSNTPFTINTELAQTPWNPETLLFRIGLKGFEVAAAERPAANLIFLIDVSGSMQSPDKLPLLKNAFRLLARQLDERDTISMVVYAGATGIVLEPTQGNQRAKIMNALDQLSAGGRTNGAAGIRLAYSLAQDAFVEDGINRVVLATDGDFNVGTVDFEALVDLVRDRRQSGISLTTLGFGTGNYNDHLMEQLADEGNGNYAYIDNLNEARKVLVEELTATLQTIAKDVKIQIEFNPSTVAEYRLIGYENRMLRREDFNNDKIDAGEIGAGHTVTALYELSLADGKGRLVDPLRYGTEQRQAAKSNELAFVRLRYKAPNGDRSNLIERALKRDEIVTVDKASDDLRFAAAVAAFGQRLRGGDYLGDFDYADIQRLSARSRAHDPHGYRGEFITLVELADSLSTPERQASR
jgi:Ca-activated chloride channel family protein